MNIMAIVVSATTVEITILVPQPYLITNYYLLHYYIMIIYVAPRYTWVRLWYVIMLTVACTELSILTIISPMHIYTIAAAVPRMYVINTHGAPPSIARGYAVKKV